MRIGQTYKVLKDGDGSTPKKDAVIRITAKNGTIYHYEVLSGEGSVEGNTRFSECADFAY